MEKLELKYLAPYLPYGLRAEILDFKIDYVGNQYDTIVSLTQWSHNGEMWSCQTEGGAKPSPDRIKPILRPSPIKNITSKDYTLNEWEFFFKNHYDVFELIEKGLAIDINTL